MGYLDDKVAVVTGAGSGMAKAAVKIFVREGARGVVAGDISGAEGDRSRGGLQRVAGALRRDARRRHRGDDASRHQRARPSTRCSTGRHLRPELIRRRRRQHDKTMNIHLRGMFFGTKHGIRP
jgi:NAD(P)-dependent dehydrogenase (short-subunit alcohol dehydrogenase family)